MDITGVSPQGSATFGVIGVNATSDSTIKIPSTNCIITETDDFSSMHEKTGSETEKRHSKIENVISEMRVDNIAVKMGSFFSLDFSIDIISLSIKCI